MLEESYRLVETQIKTIESSEKVDTEKLTKLREAKNNYFNQLSQLRRAQYEENQQVGYGDE
jgi:chaperonin cofactor prefoldin